MPCHLVSNSFIDSSSDTTNDALGSLPNSTQVDSNLMCDRQLTLGNELLGILPSSGQVKPNLTDAKHANVTNVLPDILSLKDDSRKKAKNQTPRKKVLSKLNPLKKKVNTPKSTKKSELEIMFERINAKKVNDKKKKEIEEEKERHCESPNRSQNCHAKNVTDSQEAEEVKTIKLIKPVKKKTCSEKKPKKETKNTRSTYVNKISQYFEKYAKDPELEVKKVDAGKNLSRKKNSKETVTIDENDQKIAKVEKKVEHNVEILVKEPLRSHKVKLIEVKENVQKESPNDAIMKENLPKKNVLVKDLVKMHELAPISSPKVAQKSEKSAFSDTSIASLTSFNNFSRRQNCLEGEIKSDKMSLGEKSFYEKRRAFITRNHQKNNPLVEYERKVASAKVLTSCKRKFNDAIETNDRNFEGWNNRLIGEQLPNELDQHLHTFRSGKKQKLDLINPDFVRPFSNENGTKLETFRNFGEL